MNAFAFYLRVQRGPSTGKSSTTPRILQINQEQMFAPSEYYAWFYEGSQWTTYAGGVLMVVIMLAGVMFPLWPPIMRLGVYYLSMGMLGLIGLFFVIAILRLIFYIITVIVARPGIWVFPQLFADVGFVSWPFSVFPLSLFSVLVGLTFTPPGRLVYPSLGVGPPQEEEGQEVKGREGLGHRIASKGQGQVKSRRRPCRLVEWGGRIH